MVSNFRSRMLFAPRFYVLRFLSWKPQRSSCSVFAVGLGLLLGFTAPLASGKAAKSGPALETLTLLYTGNLASRIEPSKADGAFCSFEERASDVCLGGLARLAGQANLERARTKTVLLLDAGGQFGGTDFWVQHKQNVWADLLNRVRFDAMAAGAAEFSEGSEALGKFIKMAEFPVLGANIRTDHDPYLKDQIYPILATSRGPQHLGLLGIADLNIPDKLTIPVGSMIVPIETKAPFWLKQLGFLGMKIIVALSSAGAEKDKDIAQRIAGIDVIIGLSNRSGPPREAPLVVTGSSGQPVLLVQAAPFGHYLGKLTVLFDKNGHPKSWKGEQIKLDRGAPEDPEVRDQVEVYAAALGDRRRQLSQGLQNEPERSPPFPRLMTSRAD